MDKKIAIRGAKTHNLQNVDVEIPRDQLTVITGLSGSGKSSLAFDTLYAEGQRRYVESLSAYARQFLSMMDKPDVEHIEGLSPAISIEQKATSHNPRSTVGTITEIYDYLRLLFARVGEPHCPKHNITLHAQTITQMVDQILLLPEGKKLMLLAPIVEGRKGEHVQIFEGLRSQGFVRVRVNGEVMLIDEVPKLALRKKHTIEVVIDRFKIRPNIQARLAESLETTVGLSDGIVRVVDMDDASQSWVYSAKFACPTCGYSLRELEPRTFSFNNPAGACSECDGLGTQQHFDPDRIITCPDLSLSEGAIRGWNESTVYYFSMLKSVADHYNFSLEKPFNKLSKKVQNILLHGSDEPITFRLKLRSGRVKRRKYPFEGVIPMLRRRYLETDSPSTREELAKFMTDKPCPACDGERLGLAARNVFIDNINISKLCALSIEKSSQFLDELKLTGPRATIAEKILKEIRERLQFLMNVGLDYLTLSRSSETLSGGEAQRIRLASQIGSGLVGVMYILDEPSIGLHQRDNERLLQTLTRLRDLGNSVIVVEHDEDAILRADHVIDIGPGAGTHGGRIIAEGDAKAIMRNKNSLTGAYLSGREAIHIPSIRKNWNPERVIQLTGAKCNNLQGVDIDIPLGLFTCITGVSGSGKSSLINNTLYPAVARALNQSNITVGEYDKIVNLELIDKVIDIDQSPIGRTPRSNPATYTGIFTPIRELFSNTPEARARGYKPGRFSFNVRGGRCEACQGDGVIKVEMHFLPDVYVHCDVCQGKRYNRETLEIRYKGKNIHEVLMMTVEEALDFFSAIPVLNRRLQTILDVGLSYISLGQSATTLSGGEAQRVKLSRELAKRSTGKTLYILDEPTTGLHFHDIKQLLHVLHRLTEQGNTVIVIEHNLDVIKTADWIIDLGPEGGDRGGKIIATGTPEEVSQCKHSYTGQFLKDKLPTKKSKRIAKAKCEPAQS